MERLLHAFDVKAEVPPPAVTDVQAWASRIRRAVRRETRGGVRQLKVEVDSRGIRLRGQCASFYCKQLAQQAAMRLSGEARVDNEIAVND